jgi:hypothetical protein
MIYESNKVLPSLIVKKKQQGATLMTVMVFLMLMTVVAVSGSKIAILDVLVAGNDQQKMNLYQVTSTDLKKLTTVIQLYEPLVNKTFSASTGEFNLTDSPSGVTEVITDVSKGDPNIFYECGGFSNKAVSIGSNVPPCYLYDFEVRSMLANSSAKDRHHRGAGKEKPNPRKNSTLF